MNINDIRICALYFERNFINSYFYISTYSNNTYLLVSEKKNFPHLVGIKRSARISCGYSNGNYLFNEIILNHPINTNVIPSNIATGSKMYNKVKNFLNMSDIFFKNEGPIMINYCAGKSTSFLDNTDLLLTDIKKGYMLGWVFDVDLKINNSVMIKKYCPSTWIDESSSRNPSKKEKYVPNQDVELMKHIYKFDNNSKLIKSKYFKYTAVEKKEILECVSRNQANLLIDKRNARFYVQIANKYSISCKINGVQYN